MKNPLKSQLNLTRIGAVFFSLSATAVFGQTLAFPNAEGFGRFASGGRGGEVYVVTNLNNSGAGSLRDAVTNRTAGVPRTVVFAVSGTIYLSSTLRITQGNLTIAGQTAPGDGICLAHYPIDPSNATNVIIRFIRSRLGDLHGENDAFSCRYATNIIVDHCSFSWSVDETASSYDNTNFTMQWCIISESLRDSVHSKGAHGYGAIWGGLGATFHHNLVAHHDSRNPRFNGARTHGTAGELVDMRNNVIYNWRGNSTYGGEPSDTGQPARHNMVNNTYKNGPATSTGTSRYRILEPTRNTASTGASLSLFHISGNHTTASATVTANNWNGGVQVVSSAEFPLIRADEPFVVSPVVTQSAQDSFPLVLGYSGCRLPVRDPVDTRISQEVASGTVTFNGSVNNWPGIIDSQTDVGGWPTLASTPAPADGDSDGMPDAWETARGLNPADAADRNLTDAEGYTRLEIYLNELAAPAFPIPQIGTQPVSQTLETGDAFSVSVTATGPGPLTYQWYRNGDPIPGATAASYSVIQPTALDAGQYSATVINAYGNVQSTAATIVFESQPPEIVAGPVSQSLSVGQPAVFSVSAEGTQPVIYQWYRGENPIPGATGNTLDLGPAGFDDAGIYHVVAVNAHGTDVSEEATLTVSSSGATDVFSTSFTDDTVHSASPVTTATSTNWYVMSSKNATASTVTGSRLDLTMVSTNSGIIDSAAKFANTPVSLAATGETLRLRAVITTTNVRALGLGLFHSGNSLPHTGLMNSQLSGTSSTLATGGTQLWNGFRFHLDAGGSGPATSLEGRPAQPGTNNASQSLIAPGTSSSAPTITPFGTTAAAGFLWADNAPYTLTLDLTRSAADAMTLTSAIHAGTDVSVSALATATATTTGTLPVSSFDALAIGFRNRDANSLPRLRVTEVRVQQVAEQVSVSDPFEAFLLTHELDPATDGLPAGDPDSDGIANSLEFVLGGDPVRSDTHQLPTLAVDGSVLKFRYLQHVDTSMRFKQEVQISSRLDGWGPLVHGVDGVTITRTPHSATHFQIEVRLPAANEPGRFLRLMLEPKQAARP